MTFSKQIAVFLQNENLSVHEEHTLIKSEFPLLLLPEHNLLIHCVSLQKQVADENTFTTVTETASKKNIRLIHVWEDLWLNKQKIVQSRLLALAGKSTRIYARQTRVERINKKQAEHFLNKNHLQQATQAYYKYGLTYKDSLVAVATFSKSRVMHDGPVYYRSYELERYANKTGTTVIGGLGKLLNHFIEQQDPAHIMTYADRDWSEGNSYKKLGFALAGNTPPQTFLLHTKEHIRYPLHRLPEPFQSTDEMLKAGYLKIYTSGNTKWILDRRK